MLNKIIRFFNGYLRISISGNTVERFINACSHKGIILWNLTNTQTKYEANITIRDFRKLKPVIRKTRTKVTIVEKAGFPFFLQKYHRRRLFFPGFVLCILITCFLSTYVWNIEFSGNMTYSAENLTEFLKSLDVETGMKRNQVDCFEIAREIRKNFDEIIWVSASLNGTNLNIQIKENDEIMEIEEVEQEASITPYDIVADGDFEITRLVVRNGIVQIHQNDSVKKGDLLVSGQIPILNDAKEITGYQYCVSDADIYGKKKIEYEDELSREYFVKEDSEIVKRLYALQMNNYRISLGSLKNDYESFEMHSKIYKLGEITFETKELHPYTRKAGNYTDEELSKILSVNFQYYCNDLEKKGVVILENDVKIYTWSDKAMATGNLTVEMPVGQLVKSETIEIGEPIDGNDGNNN